MGAFNDVSGCDSDQVKGRGEVKGRVWAMTTGFGSVECMVNYLHELKELHELFELHFFQDVHELQ